MSSFSNKYYLCIYVFCFILSVLVLSDIEPLLDITDFNLFQLSLFTVSVMGVILDNSSRLLTLSLLELDYTVFVYMYSYVVNSFLYFLVIWLGFFSHIMSPLSVLELDNSILNSNLLVIIFSIKIIIITLIIVCNIIDSKLSIKSTTNTWLFSSVFLLIILTLLSILVIEVFFNNNSVVISSDEHSLSLLASKGSASYSNNADLVVFDWHNVTNAAHSSAFIDYSNFLAVIFVILFLLMSLILLVSIYLNSHSKLYLVKVRNILINNIVIISMLLMLYAMPLFYSLMMVGL